MNSIAAKKSGSDRSTGIQARAMNAYPKEFKPAATHDLVRVGSAFDGGYVIPGRLMAATSGLLSFGLSDEWEFESEFAQKANVRVACFDPTVTRSFWLRKFIANLGRGLMRLDGARLRRAIRFLDYRRFFDGRQNVHHRKALGYEGKTAISLPQAIALAGIPEPLLLKMDIEGWEYRLLSDLVAMQDKFVGMAIEFHDVDLHEARIIRLLRDLADKFVLVHFHANSHTTIGPGGMALVVEMTLMNRKLLTADERLEYRPLPIPGLDAPNIPGNKEAVVVFADGPA